MRHSLASATLTWPHDPLGDRSATCAIPPAVKLYMWTMVAVAALPIAYSLIEAGALRAAPYWVGLLALTLFAGPFSIRVSSARATISASETLVLALVILFGPAPATLTVVLDALIVSLWHRDDNHYRTWFSVAQRAIAVWLSAQLYYGVSDAAPLFLEPAELGQVSLPLLALTTSYFLLSGWLAGTAVWVDHYVSPFRILKERWTQLGLNFILSLGLLALLVLNSGDPWLAAAGLLVPLLLLAYVSSKLTERRLEQRITTAEGDRTFQELAENIHDVLWIMDPQRLEFAYVSPAYERVWGRNRRDVHDPAKGWTAAIHAEDRERVLAVLSPESVARGFRVEYRVVRPDGTERWIKDRGFPISDQDGVVRRIVGMAEDTTDHWKLEQQLISSQKMEGMGRLAGGVAHDFNNLLTAILGYSESIVRQSDPRDPLHEDALEVQRAGEKAAALTRQLLAFSRRQALKMTVVDVNDVVRDVHKLLGRLLGEHIAIETKLAPNLESVTADSTQLEQILLNLAINARDAMPDGGRLTITSTADLDETDRGQFTIPAGRYATLAVADTGTGMDARTQAQIFEPFFTTKGPGEGSGLGLATVYGTVKQLGGFIEVTSAPGRGTTFTISLPATDRSVTRVARTQTASVEPGRGETILLVEDDAAVRTYTRQVLRRAGYDVLEAPTPDAALRIADESGLIHGVLTDVIMPGMNGKQMVNRLLETRPDLKVLYMSGYSGTTYSKRSIVDRTREHLLDKPFTRDTLLRTLRRVLKKDTSRSKHQERETAPVATAASTP